MEQMESFTLDAPFDSGENETTMGQMIPYEFDFEDKLTGDIVRDALPLILNERDASIAQMMLEGYSQAEIGPMLGITESRVSQIVNDRIAKQISRLVERLAA